MTTTPSIREAVAHELKTWPEYFQAVRRGEKTFELRNNDRDFQPGDTLILREWSPDGTGYTGEREVRSVGYVLKGGSFSLPSGLAILSLIGSHAVEQKEGISSERCALPSSETGSSAPPEGWREQAARIIDPEAWEKHDGWNRAALAKATGGSFSQGVPWTERAAKIVEPSLAKADALAAIVPAHNVEEPRTIELHPGPGETIQDLLNPARLVDIGYRAGFKDGLASATQPPLSEPSPGLVEAATAMLSLYDHNTCRHEGTKRGGTIWTICEECDRKWADDEGGFKPYVDPPEVADLRSALAPTHKGSQE